MFKDDLYIKTTNMGAEESYRSKVPILHAVNQVRFLALSKVPNHH